MSNPRSSTEQKERDSADAIEYANGVIGSAEDDGNKFQKAIAAWRNINLSQLVPTLDSTASDLAAHQRDALVERKELAQKTKDFRKLDDAAKLVEVKGLLKAYQTYIDLLSTQSKAVSSSFFQVYSPLSEAPDPYPLLEASIESLVVADETVPRLESENKQLHSSNLKLTKQLEDTERQLQDERQAKQSLEEVQDTRIKEVEATWSAVLSEKQDNWTSREKSLEEKVDNQERLMKEVKASYEVYQRLDRSGAVDDDAQAGASAAELEMVSSDLERANARLADVESRNEQLRLDLAQAITSKVASTPASAVEDDPAFLRLRSENSSLLRKADLVRRDRDSEKRDLENAMRNLRKEVGALKADSLVLRAKVAQWNDYDEVRKELDILKSIEFATGDVDDEEQAREGASMDETTSSHEQNLEQLLMARNKKLNNELTILRVAHQDLAGRLETLQDELSRTNMQLEQSRNLNATLENDLTRVQNESNDTQPAMSVAGTYSSRYPTGSLRRGRRPSPTSSIISGMDSAQSPAGTLESLRAGEPVGGSSGILPMITAQRDRFKKRISDLEGELTKSSQTLATLRAEVASLQKDNLSLYEKTRYVSAYSRNAPSTSASSYSFNPDSLSPAGRSTSPLDRYKSAYESRISPFAAFRGRESARALRRMSLPERILFQITRMVLQTRTSRNLFGLYLLGLHLMMFSMLWYGASADIDSHVSHMAGNAVPIVGGAAAAANGAADGWHLDGFSDETPT